VLTDQNESEEDDDGSSTPLQHLVNQAIASEPCELTFGYALPSGESLTLVAHAVYLPRPRIEISGPQGIQASFDWQAARDPGVGRMCTVTLVNGVESYWGSSAPNVSLGVHDALSQSD